MVPSKKLRHSFAAVYAVLGWGALLTWSVTTHRALSIPEWVVLYTLAGLLLLVERFHIPVTAREVVISLETVYLVAFSWNFPLKTVVCGGFLYAIVSSLRYKGNWYTQAMNALAYVAAASVSIVTAHQLAGFQTGLNIMNIPLLMAYFVVYFFVNIVVVAIYLVLQTTRENTKFLLRSIFSVRAILVYTITLMIGMLMAIVIQNAGLGGAILFTGLIILVAWSYGDYFKMANHFKELAIRDELTGVYNHRHIQFVLDKWFAAETPFAFLMLDIDHFKRYNDVWGHVQGDEVLRKIATLLQEHSQTGEVCARYSADEFVLALPGSDLDELQVRAEAIRQAVEQMELPGVERVARTRLTVSIGIAVYPEMADNKKDLLMRVDDAIYKAKVTGNNQVFLYESVLDEVQQDLVNDDPEQEIVRTLRVFLAILNSKDRYTYAHTERDVNYATALAKKIGLPEERLRYLRLGAFLHDIGKVEVPTEILTKRGPLSKDEWVVMRNHVELGVSIVRPIQSLALCLPIIRHHHERYDGAGYPDGLKTQNIPLEARILTIADSFDAMTTSRPYQRKRNLEEAIQELRQCAGKQFDPDLVEPFIEAVQALGILPSGSQMDLA
ncbi:diguanylate cyclase [Alicyclobacillaceae bacterium I2511]|nr:diguanylate cyclase [Alicyclobacillaceae bacterium I2511]